MSALLGGRALAWCALAAIGAHAIFAALFRSGAEGARLESPLVLPLLALPAFAAAALLPRIPRGRFDAWLILAAALLLRAPFLGDTPYYSDDAYRYLWDGRVQLAGLGPYGRPPQDAALDAVEEHYAPEDRVRALVNHPEVPTVYPPFAQMVFAANAAVERALIALGSPPLASWKLLLLIVDLAIGVLLARLLGARGLDPRLALLWLWHPLPIIEIAWDAHLEALAVLLLLGAFAALGARRASVAGALLGLAAASKLLPIVFLPHFVRALGWRTLPAAAVAVVVSVLPYATTDPALALAGLQTYAEAWYYNDVVFRRLGWLLGIDVENRLLPETQALRRWIAGGYGAAAASIGWFDRNSDRAALWILGLFVLLTPVLHPWYLLWVLPFAILSRHRAWLLVTATILLSHSTSTRFREQGLWREEPAIQLFEFLPPLAVWGFDFVRRSYFGRLVRGKRDLDRARTARPDDSRTLDAP